MAVQLNAEKLVDSIILLQNTFGPNFEKSYEGRVAFISGIDSDNPIKEEILKDERINEGNKNNIIDLVNSVVQHAENLEEVAKILQTRQLENVKATEKAQAAEQLQAAGALRF